MQTRIKLPVSPSLKYYANFQTQKLEAAVKTPLNLLQ